MPGRLDKAFASVDRAKFVAAKLAVSAQADAALPIGHGQTISQPSTVRLMLEWLDVSPGHKVLDVGSGSGWTTALLAQLVGREGRVLAVEIVPELVELGRQNCRRSGVTNAEFYQAGPELGLPAQAPFDRILVSAAADKLPEALIGQLKTGGKLVVPVKGDILEITKAESGNLVKSHAGFLFVPLII